MHRTITTATSPNNPRQPHAVKASPHQPNVIGHDLTPRPHQLKPVQTTPFHHYQSKLHPPTLHFWTPELHSTSRHRRWNLPADYYKTAFKTGIARMAKTVPIHSLNFITVRQQTKSLWIPNPPPQPRAQPSTIFLERDPQSSSNHEPPPQPPRPTTATPQPITTTTTPQHPLQNPVASEGTQQQTTPQPNHRNHPANFNPPSAPY